MASARNDAIKVPPLGESIVEATVSRWLKKEGDAGRRRRYAGRARDGQDHGRSARDDGGVLTKRAHAEGDVVKVDELLGEIDESAPRGRPERRRQPQLPPQPAAAAAPRRAQPHRRRRPPAAADSRAAAQPRAEVRASPAAQRVAAEAGRRLVAVPGHGSRRRRQQAGRDRARRPLRSAAPGAGAAAAPHAACADAASAASPRRRPRRPASARRARRCRRVASASPRICSQSQHATAHLTTFNEIDMSAVERAARADQGARREGARRQAHRSCRSS